MRKLRNLLPTPLRPWSNKHTHCDANTNVVVHCLPLQELGDIVEADEALLAIYISCEYSTGVLRFLDRKKPAN